MISQSDEDDNDGGVGGDSDNNNDKDNVVKWGCCLFILFEFLPSCA